MNTLDSLAFKIGKIYCLLMALMLGGILALLGRYMDGDALDMLESQRASMWIMVNMPDNFASIITNQIMIMGYILLTLSSLCVVSSILKIF